MTLPAKAVHWMWENYTWVDLTPSGDSRIWYSSCGGAYGVPTQWGQGVEAWDTGMGSLMEFDVTTGCYPWPQSNTVLQWEGQPPHDDAQCGGSYWACWFPWQWQQQSPQQGAWRNLNEGVIAFDYARYMDGDVSSGWRAVLSAHEWGHNLNLGDHGDAIMCEDFDWIMAYLPNDTSGNPCITGPSPEEENSVAEFYGWWGPSDPDWDGFSNDVENYLDTDTRDNCPDNSNDDAWPLDINKDRTITIADVMNYSGRIGASPGSPNWWQRLDLNADRVITVADVMKYIGKIGQTCHN